MKVSLLGSRELWLDETYSAYVAGMRFRDLLHFTSGDVHPKLYSILLWMWVQITSDTQRNLRLFSVIVNVVSMVAMFSLGRRILGSLWGSFATLLYALSPILLVYSLEARNYMLLVLAFLGALIMHWRVVVDGDRRPRVLIGYGALLSIMFYIHYLGIFIAVGLLCHWLVSSLPRRVRMDGAWLSYALGVFLILPGLPLLISQHRIKTAINHRLQVSYQDPEALSFSPEGRAKSSDVKALSQGVATIGGFYPAVSRLVFVLCAAPLAAAFAWGGYLGVMKGDQVCRLFFCVGLAVVSAAVAFHLVNTRYLLPLVPLAILVISRSLQDLQASARWGWSSGCVAAMVIAIYGAGFVRQVKKPHGRPWENLVRALEAEYRPGDEVVFDVLYGEVPFDFFARERQFAPRSAGFPMSISTWWGIQEHSGWGGPVITQADLDGFVTRLSGLHQKTVWLVLFETYYYDPNEALLHRLAELGTASEVALPYDPEAPKRNEGSSLRLVRIQMR